VKVEATFHLTACMGYLLGGGPFRAAPIELYFRASNHGPSPAFWKAPPWPSPPFRFLSSTPSATGPAHGLEDPAANLPLMMSVRDRHLPVQRQSRPAGLFAPPVLNSRTPKYSVVKQDRSWKKKAYRSRNPLAAFVEVALRSTF